MKTKFGVGIVFRKTQVSAKFHCPTLTITLFSEDGKSTGLLPDYRKPKEAN